MAEAKLTQAEADALIAMEKAPAEEKDAWFPNPGDRLVIALTSIDRREDFLLDVNRNEINLLKVTFQNRARQVVVLMRLDLGGAPHRNPDGEEVPCPHLHVYREGFGDKWAFPAPAANYHDLARPYDALVDFMRHCNVIRIPQIHPRLF